MAENTNKSSSNMTIEDLEIIGKFVEEASRKENITEEAGTNLLNIVNNTMLTFESKTEIKNKKDVVTSQLIMINTLETVISKININDNKNNLTLNYDNFVVQIHEMEPKNETFNIAVGKSSEDVQDVDIPIRVTIPEEAFLQAKNMTNSAMLRTCFIVYKSTTLFENFNLTENETRKDDKKINSLIISGSITGADIVNLKTKIVLSFKLENRSLYPKCVYAKIENEKLEWLEEGLNLKRYDETSGLVECETNHLTNFAVLAGYYRPNGEEPGQLTKALSLISIVGMVLSIVCLSLVIFSQMFFRKFRKGQYQIALLNLSIVLIIINLLIILGLDRTKNIIACKLVALLLHYFLLVAFAWMLIEAILQYLKFVKVFNTHVRKFTLKILIPAWALPALIVIIPASININQYGRDDYCWLAKDTFHFAFLLPLGLIIMANIIIFIRIIKGISCDRPEGMKTNQTKSRLVWLQVQAGMCCFVVMGLTWSFALLSFGEAALTMQFLFTIFNSFQGFFVFILFCLREKPVRMAWYRLLCRSKAAKKLVSSSETSSSANKYRNLVRKDYSEVSTTEMSGSKNTYSTETSVTKL